MARKKRVPTEADRRVKSLRKHVRKALRDATLLLAGEIDGADDYDENFREEWVQATKKLARVMDLVKEG